MDCSGPYNTMLRAERTGVAAGTLCRVRPSRTTLDPDSGPPALHFHAHDVTVGQLERLVVLLKGDVIELDTEELTVRGEPCDASRPSDVVRP